MTFVLEEGAIAESVSELVQNVLVEGGFDATEPQVLGWLSRRQRKMCARTRCFRKRISIGPTEANVANYPVPLEVVEILEVQVAGQLYGTGRHSDLAQGKRGWIWLSREGGVGIRDEDEAGTTQLALFPTPASRGDEVAIFAACLPPALKADDDSTLVIPPDFYDALVSGAIATGLARMESRPDLAQSFETDFNTGCQELRAQTNRRFKGSGPSQIRVVGLNA